MEFFMKNDIEIYTLSTCPFCTKAKELLRDNYLDYTEHEISDNEMAMRKKLGELFHISGNVTVPQIVINNKHIGGYSDLKELFKSGKISQYLSS